MSRFSGKNGSIMGYEKSSSIGSSSFKKAPMFEINTNITMIKDVDPMLDNITVQGRCISIWHSHKLNEAHNPTALIWFCRMCKYQDPSYIKKDWMLRFEPLFEEGKCYSILNFAIAENTGRLPLLPSKYKISFYKGTSVTRIELFDNNVNGFILELFNQLLDSTCQYHEHEAVGASNIQDEMALIRHKFKKFIKQFGKTLYKTKPFNKISYPSQHVVVVAAPLGLFVQPFEYPKECLPPLDQPAAIIPPDSYFMASANNTDTQYQHNNIHVSQQHNNSYTTPLTTYVTATT
ncbi:hypothetical protein OROHE_014488 [Orobanche hederae]